MSTLTTTTPFVFLPGSGGYSPDLSLLRADAGDPTRFETIQYPGWRGYIAPDFSAELLIEELAMQIERKVPKGPIRIMGHSMGGHFGYAAALRLQARGREIAGFCAIDSFMVTTAAPTAGWQGRALHEATELLRKGQFRDLLGFAGSRFWRALLRLAGGRVSAILNLCVSNEKLAAMLSKNQNLDREISVRLLIGKIAPWLASLDDNPLALHAPAVAIRTAATACSDGAWIRRCPKLKIYEIVANHHTLFDRENVAPLRSAFLTATAEWQPRLELTAV